MHELTAEVRARLRHDGRRVAELHRELLPLGDPEGFPARLTPYRITAPAGESVSVTVEVRNPLDRDESAVVGLVVPDGWQCEPDRCELSLSARGERRADFSLVAAGPARRVPIAADVTVGETRFGQQAEALVTVT